MEEIDKTILVAVVSASSAIVGVLISQLTVLLKEIFGKRHLKQVLLREKYEIFAESLHEAIVWSNSAGNCTNIEEIRKYGVNEPLRKCVSFSLIYFPELREGVKDFQNSYIRYFSTLLDGFEPGVERSASAQAVFKNREEYIKSSESFSRKRQELDELVEKYASKYAKA